KEGIDAVRFAYLAVDTMLSGGTKFDFLRKFFGGAVSNVAKEEYADAQYRHALMGMGAGASPTASAAGATAANPAVKVAAPTLHATINVDASGHASPKEVATETMERLDEWWNNKLIDADGSTPGYGVLRASP